MYKEKVATYGEGKILTGIATIPEMLTKDVALIYFNAGLLHRVGPHRLYVTLARQFAKNGYLSFRFDLSGLGDSILRVGVQSEDQRVLQDIKESLDYIQERYEINKFILIGLCSGADHSLLVAEKDPRVIGCSLIDGIGYRTFKYFLNHYKRRLTNINIIKAFISRKLFNKEAAPPPEIFVREFPPKAEMVKLIQNILSKGTSLQLIYTGGIEDYYNYEGQFFDCFPEFRDEKRLWIEEIRGSDHTLTHIREREEAEEVILKFINNIK